MCRKYDLVVDQSTCDYDILKKELDWLVYSKDPGSTNTIDIRIKIITDENEGFSVDDFMDELDCIYDIYDNPHFSWWESEEINDDYNDDYIDFYLEYDAEPELDLRDEYIQEKILKAYGASRDDIRRHLSAVRNGAGWAVQYHFSDVEGWLCQLEEMWEQDYLYEDLEDLEGLGILSKKDYVNHKLSEKFGTTDRQDIIGMIKGNSVNANELEGHWCYVFGQPVWVKEY